MKVILVLAFTTVVHSRSLMEPSPQLCPIDAHNLIEVKLFVDTEEKCFKMCEKKEGCKFFRHYQEMSPEPLDNLDSTSVSLNDLASSFEVRPSQCFLYRECGRKVEKASTLCKINKENTIEVKPFVKNEDDCRQLCQQNRKCGYFKYFPNPLLDGSAFYDDVGDDADAARDGEDDNENEDDVEEETSINARNNDKSGTRLIMGQSRLPNLPDLLFDTSNQKSEFCYIMRSCSKRMVDRVNCTLGKNNFLDMKMFVQTADECKKHCEMTEGCRYYWWYPIETSERPLYCYMFQQCAAKDAEPEVALVIGGRHPGHYYITHKEHSDLIMRNDVCMIKIQEDVDLARAGGVAFYHDGTAYLCGGRAMDQVQSTCLQYEPENNQWTDHSDMIVARDEASWALVGSTVYVIGGIGRKTVERTSLSAGLSPTWEQGPDLPQVLARACAAYAGPGKVIVVGGHDNSSTRSLSNAYELDIEAGQWTEIPALNQPRRDHACLYVDFEDTSGLLVTGGLGENNEVLDSVEFFDLNTRRWILTSVLKQRRTEHVMSLIYGIPTVIGGMNDVEFLSSLEQFDKSSASWNVPLERDWRVINHALNTPRYEMAVASIPISKASKLCDSDRE